MTVSNQIIAVLDAICEKFGIVIDWTASNIMPYLQDLCKRIVTYEIATSRCMDYFASRNPSSCILYPKQENQAACRSGR